MSVLVTGGAGYIGSHVTKELLSVEDSVVVLDNLSTGHEQSLHIIKRENQQKVNQRKLKIYFGDTRNRKLLMEIIKKEHVSAIVHLAAYSQVGESMQNPGKYFDNNLLGAISLLDAMVVTGVNHIIFSSTAAVYGEPSELPITEHHLTNPTNVYGASKLMVEELLNWYDHIYGIRHIALRYFNAAGADVSGLIGEHHEPETHLIPLVLQTALGIRESLAVYGDDYPTADGTCVRDYIHVSDLARAHILALQALKDGLASHHYNLGNGSGYSVKNVLDEASKITEIKIPYQIADRRSGDPAVLVADSQLISRELGWKTQYTMLEDIIASAWKWQKGHPSGYGIKS